MLKRVFWRKNFYVAIATMVFVITTLGAAPYNHPLPTIGHQPLSQETISLLKDYSEYLSTGTTTNKSYYSTQMAQLVQERRKYYEEFFDIALHTELLDLHSTYLTDANAWQEKLDDDIFHIQVTEEVTFYGKSRISWPDEYPLIKAASWALAQTDNVEVKLALGRYIVSMTDSVKESIQDGVTIVFIVRHDFSIRAEKDGAQIILDTFTDRSNDNINGNDNVSWNKNEFARSKPDLTKFPDYVIHNTPIEDLGKWLLDDYTKAYVGRQAIISDTYNRTNAKNYINYYTSNTSLTCATNVYSNPAKYASFYDYFPCNDCTNYVSQAIHAGGFSYDSDWYPYSWGWNTTYGLRDYLLYTKEAGVWYSNLTSLKVGDIAFRGDYGHVVMVGAVNPHRYSAHTSDRKIYSWHSSLTRYMHILEIPGG